MNTKSFAFAAAVTLVLTVAAYAAPVEDNWPAWRGPEANGNAIKGNPPVEWSETKNIKWKVSIPGQSDCTPIIWGDKIFLQYSIATAEDVRAKPPKDAGREIFTPMPTVPYDFKVICLSKSTGQMLWERTACTALPHEGHHPHSSFASYSPITDGEKLWVNFGSRGLYCYDLDGNQIWSAPLIQMLTLRGFGEGSSPALAGNAVIVVADHEGQSKIFAFNKDTGEKLWEKDRDEKSSWATPYPVLVDGAYQAVVSGNGRVFSYDTATGDVVWTCEGLLPGAIPSPVAGFGKVYCMTGYQKYALLAINLGHKGDLTGTDAVAWQLDRGTPYVSSPLLYNGRIYFVEGNNAKLSCYDAQTGKPHFEDQRLEGLKQIYASPMGAGGHVYIADREGNVMVIKDSDTFEKVALNTLDEGFDGSPVVVGNELFLRGEFSLYCIAEK